MNEHMTTAARVLMGDSLGFHIIFVLFGLTLPIIVCWFEWLAVRRNDAALRDTAYLLSKVMTVLVITGVISGTIIAFQMSLVWPGILQFGGKVIGLPFLFETYAFLIEAVFLGLYMVTWNRKKVSPYVHLLFGLMVVVGGTMSAYAITSVNAFMNVPTGFTMIDGKMQDIRVFDAMFSEGALIQFAHSMLAYYIAGALAVAGVYGFKIARSRYAHRLSAKHRVDWLVIHHMAVFAAVAAIGSAVTADLTGKYLATYEPAKLATLEMVNTTTTNVPFIFGGVEGKDGAVAGPHISVPSGLSVLVGGSPDSVVRGLDTVPQQERPPVYIRALFNIKLTLIGLLCLGLGIYFVLKKWRPAWLGRTVVLTTLSVCSFVGIVIVELGWMLTEIGRQPWAVRGYVTTADAITKTHDITGYGYFFPVSYVFLFVMTILAVRQVVRMHRTKGGRV